MDKEIYEQLAIDVSKNFALDTSEGDLDLQNFFEIFRERLAAHIFDLIQNDYNRLLAILYRIDVDEKKVRECLEGNGVSDVAEGLAGLIIDRLIQKIEYRMGKR
jgi:hypothetical protein